MAADLLFEIAVLFCFGMMRLSKESICTSLHLPDPSSTPSHCTAHYHQLCLTFLPECLEGIAVLLLRTDLSISVNQCFVVASLRLSTSACAAMARPTEPSSIIPIPDSQEFAPLSLAVTGEAFHTHGRRKPLSVSSTLTHCSASDLVVLAGPTLKRVGAGGTG